MEKLFNEKTEVKDCLILGCYENWVPCYCTLDSACVILFKNKPDVDWLRILYAE
jgi:hypothetical protein